uniref:aldehyde dehydrogenase family protein n=1 Tax=Pseudonocardia pini TaxID=2758030 RepID=UPI0015F0C649
MSLASTTVDRLPDSGAAETAVRAAVEVAPQLARLPAGRRAEVLRTVADSLLVEAADEAARITEATGKPIRWSRTEVDRTAAIL